MDSVGRAALEGAALGALAGGVGAAVGAAGLSGAAAFAVSEGADFIGGFLYDIGVNGLSREEALINGLMGIGFGGAIGLLGRGLSRAARRSGLLDRVPRSTPAPSRICPASFSADTLIATPEGDKPISEIEVGDVILAYSEATEEVDIYHVSATHNQRHDSTLDITIDGETLHTTDEHPFYVIRDDQEQWVQAKHLHIGDAILSALGETGIVEDIIIIDQPQMMYNLTVALVATYMVGDGQWVVHNQDEPIAIQSLPGRSGIQVPRQIQPQQMADLTNRWYGYEFLLQRVYVPLVNNQWEAEWWLYSGDKRRILAPVGVDRIDIYHTHPSGAPFPSQADLDRLQQQVEFQQQFWGQSITNEAGIIPAVGPFEGQVITYNHTQSFDIGANSRQAQEWRKWRERFNKWLSDNSGDGC